MPMIPVVSLELALIVIKRGIRAFRISVQNPDHPRSVCKVRFHVFVTYEMIIYVQIVCTLTLQTVVVGVFRILLLARTLVAMAGCNASVPTESDRVRHRPDRRVPVKAAILYCTSYYYSPL